MLRETTVCRAEACVCLLLHYLTKLFVFVRGVGALAFFLRGPGEGSCVLGSCNIPKTELGRCTENETVTEEGQWQVLQARPLFSADHGADERGFGGAERCR